MNLIQKFNVTSFLQSNAREGISLYFHLPFCESLCTFSGCNKRISKRHEVESQRIAAVLQEWALYVKFIEERPVIKVIILGGGTCSSSSTDFFNMPIELRNTISVLKTIRTIRDHSLKSSEENISEVQDFFIEAGPKHFDNRTIAHDDVLREIKGIFRV